MLQSRLDRIIRETKAQGFEVFHSGGHVAVYMPYEEEAQFYKVESNVTNTYSFIGTRLSTMKILPDLSKEDFRKVIQASLYSLGVVA